jgi:glutaredoxin
MNGCPYSEAAIELLESKHINYNKIIKKIPQLKEQFGPDATFPRIFDSKGKLIGGYDDLSKKLKNEI